MCCRWAVVDAPGLHPTTISEAFQRAADKSVEVLQGMSISVDLSERDALLQSASTSLSSKVRRHPGSLGCGSTVIYGQSAFSMFFLLTDVWGGGSL